MTVRNELRTTCVAASSGGWHVERISNAAPEAYDQDVVMLAASCGPVRQRGVTGRMGARTMAAWFAHAAA